ncbi:fumarylacetoacetate hydrolase family protein [Pseudoruegeria sp. HB172150]|uniref:fumarylacetoacetate hydrolase family protein n=1 Tax=Pseudoruegeria sp. HB172150 TaxID=2721164 RepID=UPI00155477DE|nr:fumarylacetoacetate hydrolase family protein [Pseudoruegeria sp. HB172150]
MRFATVEAGGERHYGGVTGAGFAAVDDLFPDWRTLRDVVEAGGFERLAEEAEARGETHALSEVTFLPPVPDPEKIICVGVNFPDRNAEYKDGQEAPPNMSLFPRFPRSFTGHGQPLIRPPESEMLDYEGEIAIVIGRGGRRIPEAEAWDRIGAVTLCNEGTIRDWVRHAKFNVTQGKNWDRSGAMGPWLVPFTGRGMLDDVEITTKVNGELRQQDRTSRMLFPIPRQIAYISTFTTLVPGDIIVTGTPTGAGARFDPPKFLKPGDEIEVSVDGIGALVNGVADE